MGGMFGGDDDDYGCESDSPPVKSYSPAETLNVLLND